MTSLEDWTHETGSFHHIKIMRAKFLSIVIPLNLNAYFLPNLLMILILIIYNPFSLRNTHFRNQVLSAVIITRQVYLKLRLNKRQLRRSIQGWVIIDYKVNHEFIILVIILAFFHQIRSHPMFTIFTIKFIVPSFTLYHKGLTSTDDLSFTDISIFIQVLHDATIVS